MKNGLVNKVILCCLLVYIEIDGLLMVCIGLLWLGFVFLSLGRLNFRCCEEIGEFRKLYKWNNNGGF